MSEQFKDREKVYEDLCKDKTYPCQRCKRKTDPQERIECGDKGCDRWQAWFRRTWRNVREAWDDIKYGG